MKRLAIAAVSVTVLALSIGGAITRPDLMMRSATGVTAHNLCSGTFVSGGSPDQIFASGIAPLLGGAARFVRYRVDNSRRTVTASFLGLQGATAEYHEGFGCRLKYPEAVELPTVNPREARAQSFPMAITSDLAVALDQVFSERAGAPMKRVKAVVVVRGGQIVAERYALGATAETPLLGWSIAKSFTNALVGILIRDGRLSIDRQALSLEWPVGDRRRDLTVEDLLRMRSGLDAPETGAGGDVVNRMLYDAPDMAAFAAQQPLAREPRVEWDYTSANTLILNRLVGQIVGGGPAGMREFAQRELFAPIGMRGVTMEFDAAGTFIGSSYLYATARDFARFGLLILADGVAPDGQRVLPAGWAAWSARSTLGRGYGAGFWTNDGPSDAARHRIEAGFPADGFFASGNRGQRIYILPSDSLVIVRLGDSDPPDFGMDDDLALIKAARSGDTHHE